MSWFSSVWNVSRLVVAISRFLLIPGILLESGLFSRSSPTDIAVGQWLAVGPGLILGVLPFLRSV